MLSSLVSPQTSHARYPSGISLLCLRTLTSAQALTAPQETVCIHTNTVYHSTPFFRLSSPKTRHTWYASHTEPTVTRLGYAVSQTHVPRDAYRVTHPHRFTQPHLSSFAVLFTPSSKIFTSSNAPPPVIRVTASPRAHVCHTHTVYYLEPYLAHASFVFLSFLRQDFRLHPPSPVPLPHRPPASGRRVSQHLFPRAYLRVPVI